LDAASLVSGIGQNSCSVNKIVRMSWQLNDGKENNTPYFFFVDARRLPKHHSFALIVVLNNGSIV
jgi:hypothetical protein